MTELAIQQATADDWPGIFRLFQLSFHSAYDEDIDRAGRSVFEPDRSLLVRDGEAIVAHAAAFTRDLTVPGAQLPAAHVTMVAVAPTHRRRRLLTRLMQRQLSSVPEPVAVLWASEGQIYPRFGYGMASQRLHLSIDTGEVRVPEPTEPGRLRTATPSGALPELRAVYESVRPTRPGWSSRDDRWWAYRLTDAPGRRHGATELRAVLHEGATGVDGYALWRAKSAWTDTGPGGEVSVDEVVTGDPDAYRTLWRFLISIDLTRSVKLWLGSPDEPLLQLADAPRRLGAGLGDGLYLRIVDLPAALSARRYAAPVDVVLDVTDPLLPGNTGRWRLVADPQKATCTRTDEPADLACGIADLGAAYLGGTTLTALAAAGRVRDLRAGRSSPPATGATPSDPLATAATAFGWQRAPSGIEIF